MVTSTSTSTADRTVMSAPDEAEEWQVQRRQLLDRIESMQVIEQAKGLLMGRYGIGAEAAFALLRRWSNNHNLKVRTISDLLVAAVSKPAPTRPEPQAELLQSVIDRLNDFEPLDVESL